MGRASERLAWAAEVVAPQETDRVLRPGGRAVVALSLTTAEASEPVTGAITRPAGERGIERVAVHRRATSPYESVAVELRRA